jgi:putative peptidoglycan lipid II flippase
VANQIAYIVIIVFTGEITDGYQIYASAFILFQLPHAIVAVSIFTALLPPLSGRWAAGDIDGLRTLFSRGVRDTVVVIVPAALGYLALAVPIVSLLLQHGRADAADAENIAHTLQAFAVGLPFFSAFQLLTRTFYAMQDTRTPALVNVAAAVVNIAANLLYLSFDWGVPGLALGHATSYAFATIVCLVVLRKRLVRIDGARIASTLLRVIPAALLAAGAAFLASRGVSHVFDGATGTLVRLLEVSAGVVVGVLVFAMSALIVGIDEADEVKDAVLRRFRR